MKFESMNSCKLLIPFSISQVLEACFLSNLKHCFNTNLQPRVDSDRTININPFLPAFVCVCVCFVNLTSHSLLYKLKRKIKSTTKDVR